MSTKEFSQWDRSPLIEENSHSDNLWGSETFGGMIKDQAYLLKSNTREQGDKLRDLHSVF
jgi:hypothetical protein